MDEVRARLIEELRLRTEERVRHWNQLGDWCRQRPGRYIGVEWRPDLRGGSSSATEEDINQVTGAVAEEGVTVAVLSATPKSSNITLTLSKRRS